MVIIYNMGTMKHSLQILVCNYKLTEETYYVSLYKLHSIKFFSSYLIHISHNTPRFLVKTTRNIWFYKVLCDDRLLSPWDNMIHHQPFLFSKIYFLSQNHTRYLASMRSQVTTTWTNISQNLVSDFNHSSQDWMKLFFTLVIVLQFLWYAKQSYL